MKASSIFILATCILVASSSCRKRSIIPVNGHGDVVSKTYDKSDFDRIDLSIGADVEYMQDNAYYVEISAQSNIHKSLDIYVEGSTLHIDSKKNIWKHKPIRVTVHSPAIYGFELSGSGSLNAQQLSTSSMDVRISGSGSVSIASLRAQSLSASLSGSGKLSISGGAVTDESVQASGSGDIDVLGLASEKSNTRLSGSGSARVQASKALDVSISGSGSVRYIGQPAINSRISGSGKLISLN